MYTWIIRFDYFAIRKFKNLMSLLVYQMNNQTVKYRVLDE